MVKYLSGYSWELLLSEAMEAGCNVTHSCTQTHTRYHGISLGKDNIFALCYSPCTRDVRNELLISIW